MGWGQTSLGFELLWGSGHDGGYPALHLLRQVVSGRLQTNGFVTWGVAKEGGSDPERVRFRPVVEVSAGVGGVVAAAMGAGTSLPGRGGEVEDAEASAMTESVWCVSGADWESAYQQVASGLSRKSQRRASSPRNSHRGLWLDCLQYRCGHLECMCHTCTKNKVV